MARRAGERIGGHVLEHLIGEGSMGEVYAATHEFLRVRVALKLLHREYCGEVDLVEKMRAEAQLLRKLDHPNLVRVSDAGTTPEGIVWMAMELLEGENLRAALVRQPRLPLEVVLGYAAQAASGLCAAHAQGVVHRDIKPENVFITSAGELKLLDFGTAKFRLLGRTAVDGQRFATVAYAPPEQLAGEALDGRADVYALGLVMHEALTGAHYLRRTDGSFPPLAEMMMLQLSAEPRLDALPPPVAEVLRRATAKRPADRHASMQELAQALDGLQRRHAAPSEDHGGVAIGKSDPQRGVRLSTTLGLAVLVAALSSAATLVFETRSAPVDDIATQAAAPGASSVAARSSVVPQRSVAPAASTPAPSASAGVASSSPDASPRPVPARPSPQRPDPLPLPTPPPGPFKRF